MPSWRFFNGPQTSSRHSCPERDDCLLANLPALALFYPSTPHATHPRRGGPYGEEARGRIEIDGKRERDRDAAKHIGSDFERSLRCARKRVRQRRRYGGKKKKTNRKGKKIDIVNADSEKYSPLKCSKVVIGNCFSAFSLDICCESRRPLSKILFCTLI